MTNRERAHNMLWEHRLSRASDPACGSSVALSGLCPSALCWLEKHLERAFDDAEMRGRAKQVDLYNALEDQRYERRMKRWRRERDEGAD